MRAQKIWMIVGFIVIIGFVIIWWYDPPKEVALVADGNGNLVTEQKGILAIDHTIEQSILVEHWSDIDKVTKYLTDLKVPQYIPDQYEFQTLFLEMIGGNYIATYTYKNAADQKIIICQNADEMTVTGSISESEKNRILETLM